MRKETLMKIRTATMIIAAALSAGTLFAQPGPPPAAPHTPGMPMRESFMEKLNLTDAQKDQMGKLRTQFEKANEELASKLRLNRIDLRDLLRAEKPDKAAIVKNVTAASEIQQKMKLAHIDHLFALRDILTPEQQKLWKNHMAQALGNFQERARDMHRGMRPRGTPGMMHGMQAPQAPEGEK
jgi:Spy/CpxP family protein refolding chaperone